MQHRPRLPAWSVALAALAAYALAAAFHLRANHWDVTTFIVAGDVFTDRAKLDAPIAVQPNSPGYDGQFFYRLALDPFTAETTAHGVRIDTPELRGARILFPLLAWAAASAQPALVPWAMLALNLAGTAALAWMGVRIARTHAAPAWTGLLPAFYPGFIVSMIRDTAEIVAAACVVASLLFALRRRVWPAALFASLAILARETTLLALAGFGLLELATCLRARRLSPALAAYLLPPIVLVAWRLAVLWHWNLASLGDLAANDLGPPFAGMIAFFAGLIGGTAGPPPPVRLYWLVEALMLLASFALFLAIALQRRAPAALRLSWALYAALIVCFTTAIWVEPYAFFRACTEGFVLGAVMVILARDRWPAFALLALVAPLWLLCAAKL